MSIKAFTIIFLSIFVWGCGSLRTSKTVIAHRGASGYLPEHTLEAVSMAHSWDVDYIEPDIVITKDNRAVIFHDIHIDSTTNIKKKYPNRARKDGRYYAVDFTLAELKRLSLNERVHVDTGKRYFPKRFPLNKSSFQVPTLEEYIEHVQSLNKSRNKNIGIYPEIKKPEFHTKNGKDIVKITMKILTKYGYTDKNSGAIIQCFYPPTLKKLKTKYKTKLPLVQLIADDSWKESSAKYSKMLTPAGIKEISTYADGIGPWLGQIYKKNGQATDLIKRAHEAGLKVHPYTHRLEQIPPQFKTSDDFLKDILFQQNADGIFSDFADTVVKFLN
jgi:glycerophosphoryl diester phosphodiesterase